MSVVKYKNNNLKELKLILKSSFSKNGVVNFIAFKFTILYV